jgi:hypothetical protein
MRFVSLLQHWHIADGDPMAFGCGIAKGGAGLSECALSILNTRERTWIRLKVESFSRPRMARRLKIESDVVFTGGVAKSSGLEEYLGRKVLVPDEPLLSGALGAALMGRDIVIRAMAKNDPIRRAPAVWKRLPSSARRTHDVFHGSGRWVEDL